MNNHAPPEATGPLEKRIKIEPEDPDFPPSKPPTPPPKPAAKFYLPPGKSTNVSLWTVEDVRLWVGKFLKPSEHAETFRTLAELKINGAVIKSIYEKKPAHTTFGINLEDFEAIQAHAHKLFNIRIANNYWDDPAYEYFLPNNIHFRLAGPAELNPPEVPANLNAAPEAASPLENDIKIELMDPDFPPSKPPTPSPKPEAKFYLPRGKTTDVSLWTEKDVRCWVAKFLKRSEHVETFRTLKELKIDGAVIETIYLNKPAHTTYGINLEDYETIQAHAHKVFMAQDTSGIRWLQSPFRWF